MSPYKLPESENAQGKIYTTPQEYLTIKKKF